MAIEIDRKINVRSPYFVEVVDEYLGGVIPPVIPPVTEVPVVSTNPLSCASIFYYGTVIGIIRFRVDGSDKELGTYTFEIGGIKMPVKYSVYVEGETPPAYTTMGLDTYAAQWLAATGEGAGSLSAEAANPTGVTVSTTYTTAATDASKNIIVEVYAPIETISNMTIESISCPAVKSATTGSGFVTVVTVESRGIFKGALGQQAIASDVRVTLNGTEYSMPNTNYSSGLRLILDDDTPNYDVSTNIQPYSGNFYGNTRWSYDEGSSGKQMVPQEVNPTLVRLGTNTLVITANPNVNFNMMVRVMQHPVEVVGGVKIIRHLGDSGTSELRGIQNGFNLGILRTASSEESLTLKFSGVNEETLVSESAVYHHEVTINVGDSQERFDNLKSPTDFFPVKSTF